MHSKSLTQLWAPYAVVVAPKPSPSWQDAPSSHVSEIGPHPVEKQYKCQQNILHPLHNTNSIVTLSENDSILDDGPYELNGTYRAKFNKYATHTPDITRIVPSKTCI